MNTVTILRQLWARRRLVACTAVLALVVGYGATFGLSAPSLSGGNRMAVASERLLVDTPDSQIVAIAPSGLDLLTSRATLLASLMTDGVVKTVIARRAGLQPDELSGVAEAVIPDPNQVPTPAPQAQSYVLTTNVLNAAAGGPDGSQLPIISIEAQAPDPSGATRLANAAVAGLRDYLGSVAASEGVPEARRLRVTSLGAPVAVAVVQAPGLMLGVAAFVVVFLLGCGVIIVIPAMVREWRGASDHQVPVALNRHIPAAPDVPVPVALDHHIPVASDRHVPLAADRHVPVASAIPAPVSAEKPLPVPVRTVERPTGFSYVSVPVDDRREPDVDIAPGERLRREVARHQ